MKQKQVLFSLLFAGFVAVGVSVWAASAVSAADTPNCSILPQALCTSSDEADPKKSGITQIIIFVLNVLTAAVGVAALAAFVYAGVLYASAGDKSDQVTKAKDLMKDTVIGIIVYAAIYLGIMWLLPGGIIG